MVKKLVNIIMFDGACNLCNSSVSFVSKRDKMGKFAFIALQSTEGQDLLSQYNLSQEDFDTVIFIQNGEVYKKSTAGLRILRELGGIWKILYALIIIPRPIRDLVYDLVAKSRYRIFGKKHSCQLPIQ